jgi:uroporphyrinogen III methyltransferase/synthase
VETVENLRILCLRAQVANPELVQELEDLGGIVDDVACYQTLPETSDREGFVAALQADGADWITFTSASTVEHFNARVPLKTLRERHPGIRFASIGPETSKALKELGLKADVEAKVHTVEGLVAALTRSAG